VRILGHSLASAEAVSALEINQTWNTTGTPTAIKANVTDTASNASSLLMDLQVGGVSRARVSKTASISLIPTDNSSTHGIELLTSGGVANAAVRNSPNTGVLSLVSTVATDVTTGVLYLTNDTRLFRDAANTLAQRNAGNAQRFNLYGTFTDASNYERMFLEYNTTGTAYRIGTEKAGTGSARALELQTDGTTRLTINAVGIFSAQLDIISGKDVYCAANRYIGGNGVAGFQFTATSIMATQRLAFSGTTSSFPAIKRNAAALNFRLADDTADADITAAALTLSGNLTISTKNIVTDTTTGTKIGTANTQKLAFWNATPVVQPTAVADATDAASVITQLNALLSRMRDLGLIAT
jgi:adenosyl cobinamide kinase/adenosyl cobinamide phosphate guanylyltransferase